MTLRQAFVHGSFIRSTVGSGVSSPPHEQYMVVKVKPNIYYRISTISLFLGNSKAGDYHACDGSRALAFKVSPGAVRYVADVVFDASQGKFGAAYRKDYYVAKGYMSLNYPKLSAVLDDQPYELLTTTESCNPDPAPATIIYIPPKKR